MGVVTWEGCDPKGGVCCCGGVVVGSGGGDKIGHVGEETAGERGSWWNHQGWMTCIKWKHSVPTQ